jgi:hypothetical protein
MWWNSAAETYDEIYTSSPNISVFWVTKTYILSGEYQYFKEHAVFVCRLFQIFPFDYSVLPSQAVP